MRRSPPSRVVGRSLLVAFAGLLALACDSSGSSGRSSEAAPGGLFLNAARGAASQTALDHPNISGVLVLSDWATTEPVQGTFDWTSVDDALDQAAANDKHVRLAIHSGGTGVPDWIDQMLDVNGGTIASIEATRHDGVIFRIPAFWDDTFIRHKKAFYRTMALRYGAHPSVAAIGASMADPFTGDWGFHRVNPQSAAAAGYNSVVFASHWRDLVQEVMMAAPGKLVATAVGATPAVLIALVNPGEDRFYAFQTAMSLMRDDADVEMSRLICGKGSLTARTPNPKDPSLSIPDDLQEWRTMYEAIHVYGAKGFAQTVTSVTNDPDFKMNAGVPYGGPGELTKAEVFMDAATAAAGYELLWLEPWEIDVLNDGDPQLQSAIAMADLLFP